MRSITDIIGHFKQNWTEELSAGAIAQACRKADMTWRNSTLDPITTIQIFFLQVLHGNTACEHLSHLTGMSFTAAAYCRARMRIKLDVFRMLLERCVGQMHQDTLDAARWLGHRVFHLDGSSFSMPDTAQLHPELQPGDLLVGDRGFCSFAHWALLLQRGVHGLMRIHQRTIVDFTSGRAYNDPRGSKADHKTGRPRSRWIRQPGTTDQIVQWLKPASKPVWMSGEQFAALPASIEVRELRYTIHEKGFRPNTITLVTTLLDADRYSLSDLADQFRQRWAKLSRNTVKPISVTSKRR